MTILHDLAASIATAWRNRWPFTAVHLAANLAVAAVIAPLGSFLLAAAIATSDQSALTDQDIALFLVTPWGFAAALAVFGLTLIAAILDVSVMTALLRRRRRSALGALHLGLALCNGALAVLLNDVYTEAAGPAPDSDLPASGTRESVRFPIAVIGSVAVLVVAGGALAAGMLLERVATVREVEIIVHRGAAALRPENTMAAVTKAIEDGADWVEIDVQETADGEIIIAHDSDFMKLGQTPLKVWNAMMADVARIDIGIWFDPAYAGERTPTLREVLLAAKGRSKLLIELKYYGDAVALEQRVAQLVEAAEMSDEVAVMSLKYPGVLKMRALRPDWRYGVLAATAIGDLSGLQADFLAVNTGQASRAG